MRKNRLSSKAVEYVNALVAKDADGSIIGVMNVCTGHDDIYGAIRCQGLVGKCLNLKSSALRVRTAAGAKCASVASATRRKCVRMPACVGLL